MNCVVDASVAAKWFFEEPLTPNARELLRRGGDLVAPDLLLLEVANVGRKRAARGQVPGEQARALTAALPQLLSLLVPSAEVLDAAAQLSLRLGHSVYDCAYLAIAGGRSLSLVAADHRLLERLASSGGWAGEAVHLEQIGR